MVVSDIRACVCVSSCMCVYLQWPEAFYNMQNFKNVSQSFCISCLIYLPEYACMCVRVARRRVYVFSFLRKFYYFDFLI